ncbi:MAG: co-chaperone GroES [bacterium]|nr:co-chaperone GroES [bacterium]
MAKGNKSRPSASGQKSKIMPLADRVLVRPFTEEALRLVRQAHSKQAQGKSPSYGIILPDTVSKEKSAQGKVLAVGEGKWLDGKLVPIRVKVGDIIFFSKYGYDEVEQDGEELYLLKEDNILAIIKS